MSRCKIPAVTIFVVCGFFCAAIAAISGVVMFHFMFGVVERSVIKEGMNQADAVGAPITSRFDIIHSTRNEIVGTFQRMARNGENGNYNLAKIGDNVSLMTEFLNETFTPWLVSMCVSDIFQGAEIGVMLPRGIEEPTEATTMSRVSVYYEPTHDGNGRVFNLDISKDDGFFHIYQLENASEPSATYISSEMSKTNISSSLKDQYVEFVEDSSYFNAYVSTHGYPYFYAEDYRYAFGGPYLFEVTVYQTVMVWYKKVREVLTASEDTKIIIFDASQKLVIASSFSKNDERIRNCYDNYTHFFTTNKDTCLLKPYNLLGINLLTGLVDAAMKPEWAESGVEVETVNSEEEVQGEDYYIVSKQLANYNSLRPFLIWARTVSSVSRELRNNTIIVVVIASLCILFAVVLVAVVSAICLLAPLRHLQTRMDKLTRLEGESDISSVVHTEGGDVEMERINERRQSYAMRRKTLDLLDNVDAAVDVDGSPQSRLPPDSHPQSTGVKKPLPSRSMISEVNDLQNHFSNMARVLMSFAKYVPRDVVKELIASGNVAGRGMTERYITLMFVDIAGFTTLCESLDSADSVSYLLSLFFSSSTKRLQVHGATIDKFIGDCIMAFWGAPLAVENPNFRGLCAGLDLLRTSRLINKEFQRHNTNLRIRIGMHCGRALVGNIGSDDRINYTALGDVVNSASRLEGINKQFFSQFLASEHVLLGSKKAHLFVTRFVGSVALRGKSKVIPSFHICGTCFESTEEAKRARGRHHHKNNDECNGSASSSVPRELLMSMEDIAVADDAAAGSGHDDYGDERHNDGVSTTTGSIDRVSDIRQGMLQVRESYNVVAKDSCLSPGIAHLCALFSDAVDGKQSTFASSVLYRIDNRVQNVKSLGINTNTPHSTGPYFAFGTGGCSDTTDMLLGNPDGKDTATLVAEERERYRQLYSYISRLMEESPSTPDNTTSISTFTKQTNLSLQMENYSTKPIQHHHEGLETMEQLRYDLGRLTETEQLILDSIMKDLSCRIQSE